MDGRDRVFAQVVDVAVARFDGVVETVEIAEHGPHGRGVIVR